MRFVILTHGKETSVAQHRCNSIATCFDLFGYIMCVVEISFAVISRIGCQHLVTNLFTINVQFIHTQSG